MTNRTEAPSFGGGGGGAIRLMAPVVDGSGSLRVEGPQGYGGLARIRSDTLDHGVWNFNMLGRAATASKCTFSLHSFLGSTKWKLLAKASQLAQRISSKSNLGLMPRLNKTIELQEKDFTGKVPIEVVVVPENGARTLYPVTIDIAAGNPAEGSVQVS